MDETIKVWMCTTIGKRNIPGAKMINFFNDHLRLMAVLSSPAEEKIRTKNLLKTTEKQID
jgi:hypothetical protein